MFGFSVCFVSILISAIFFCWNCIHILNHLIVIYLIAKLFCLSAVMVVVSDMCAHLSENVLATCTDNSLFFLCGDNNIT